MTMYQGLDLSRFKKVSSDKKTSTLRHNQGHQITIAHGSLSPKMREHIESMPVHMAEGGDPVETDDDDDPSAAPDTEAPGNDDPSGGTAEAPAPTPDAPPPAPMAPAAPTPPSPADSPAPEAAPAAPAPAQSGNVVVVQGVRKTPAEIAQARNNHDLEFQNDLAKGYIKPETYHDLYAKKDTTGKLGMLFGLLVSGAGSGLSHQPNAVMSMMDKEIERDLEAQKAGNNNAQNWYSMSLQHELQSAQIPEIQARTNASQASAYEHAAAGDLTRGKLMQLQKQFPGLDMAASNGARNYMMAAQKQSWQDMINKMPPGAGRDQAQATLDNVVTPAIQAKTTENNGKTAAHQGLIDAVKTAKGTKSPAANGQAGGAINYGKLNGMIQESRVMANNGLTPKLTESDIAKIKEEASEIEKNRANMKAYNHAFTKLWNAKDKGALNEDLYNAETAILGPEAAKATAGRFNQQESGKQTSGMFPSWKDFLSGAAPEKYNNTMTYFKSKEDQATTLKGFPGLLTPMPEFPSPFGEKKKESKYKIFNGKKYMRGPNGEAVEVK